MSKLVVTEHFWQGQERHTITHDLRELRAALPADRAEELLTTGRTCWGWSDYYVHEEGRHAPPPRWIAAKIKPGPYQVFSVGRTDESGRMHWAWKEGEQ